MKNWFKACYRINIIIINFLKKNRIFLSSLRNQNYKNENSSSKNSWWNWLINYTPEIVKKTDGDVKDITSLLKQTQPRTIVNQESKKLKNNQKTK